MLALYVPKFSLAQYWDLQAYRGSSKGGADGMTRGEGPASVLRTPRLVWRQNPNVFNLGKIKQPYHKDKPHGIATIFPSGILPT
jgi:hypothetical protein